MTDKGFAVVYRWERWRRCLRAHARPAIIVLLTVMTATAAGCGQKTSGIPREEVRAIPVQTVTASLETIEKTVFIPGRVVPGREAVITAKAAGRVNEVTVALGDAVTKGQPLVRLETADPRAQLQQARAAFDNAQADYERMKILFDEGAISRQQWEQTSFQRTQAEVALDLARSALDNTTIVAPFDGHVISIAVEAGELASPGVPLLIVMDASQLLLEGSVSDNHAGLITAGQAVRVETDALPGVGFAGTVEAVSPGADAQRHTFPVRIALPDPPAGLKPGMFARAALALGRREGVVAVPLEAVMGRDEAKYLFVVEGEVARRRPVGTGLSDGVNLEITNGLEAGERVVVVGQQYLKDGAPVRITDETPPAGSAADVGGDR